MEDLAVLSFTNLAEERKTSYKYSLWNLHLLYSPISLDGIRNESANGDLGKGPSAASPKRIR